MNIYDQMNQMVDEAQSTMDAADRVVWKLAKILIGRLRHVPSGWVLRQLKKELADYNMHTGQWK